MGAMLSETGWAKLNLALHVRHRRPDGYHDIETLFAFADDGDRLNARVADYDSLTIGGEFSEILSSGADNLVLQALSALRQYYGQGVIPPLALELEKRLPVAAGLGGGSADAAALVRLVQRHFVPNADLESLARLVAPLGADIKACIASETCLGRGTGADLHPAQDLSLSGTPVLIVNPRQPLATGPVFAGWDGIDRGALFTGLSQRSQLLACRNDLQRPAMAQCPAITDVLTELGGLRPWLARMSGSGASCFAMFDAGAERDEAAAHMSRTHPQWWLMARSLR